MSHNGGKGVGPTLWAVIVGGILVMLVAVFAFGDIRSHKTASVTITAPANTR